jgi:hypothetical protein
MSEKTERKGPARLKAWCARQRPPWNLIFLAQVLDVNYTHLSNLMSYRQNRKPSYPVAFKIEILTGGYVTVEDMLLSPEEQLQLEESIRMRWPETPVIRKAAIGG